METNTIVKTALLIVVGVVIGWLLTSRIAFGSVGPTSPESNGSNIVASENIGTPLLQFRDSSNLVQKQVTVSNGNLNSASSTIFDVANPFAATSTATIVLGGIGNATTTSFSVGTTTKSSGLALTDLGFSGSLLASASIATSSQFVINAGQTTVLGTGQVSSGSGSVIKIVVGPNERVAGFATTTAPVGAGTANYVGGYTAGFYDITWETHRLP